MFKKFSKHKTFLNTKFVLGIKLSLRHDKFLTQNLMGRVFLGDQNCENQKFLNKTFRAVNWQRRKLPHYILFLPPLFSFFSPPLSTFLIHGVLRSKILFIKS